MFKPLKPPIVNAPYKGPLTSEGLHVEGNYAMIEKVSINAPPPLDLLRPASSSSLLQDVDEPLTLRMDVDSTIDSLLNIFNIAANTRGLSLVEYIMYNKGKFNYYYKQIMASRGLNNKFSV